MRSLTASTFRTASRPRRFSKTPKATSAPAQIMMNGSGDKRKLRHLADRSWQRAYDGKRLRNLKVAERGKHVSVSFTTPLKQPVAPESRPAIPPPAGGVDGDCADHRESSASLDCPGVLPEGRKGNPNCSRVASSNSATEHASSITCTSTGNPPAPVFRPAKIDCR